MKSFVFSVILLCAIIIGAIFNSFYAKSLYDEFSEIIGGMPDTNDPDGISEYYETVKDFAQKNKNYFYITLPRTTINDFYSELEEMLGYFRSDDNASYNAYLDRIKLRIKQLRYTEEFRFF